MSLPLGMDLPENKQQEAADEAFEALSRFVNGMCHENGRFVDRVMREHRTLQQQMFRLFLGVVERWAEQNHWDARNEYTVKKSKEIIRLLEENGSSYISSVPYI